MACHTGYAPALHFGDPLGDPVWRFGVAGRAESASGSADVVCWSTPEPPQLSATTLFGAGTPLLPIMGSTMVITSQHLLYGFTFRRDVLPLSLRWRACLAFFLTDEMFAVALKDRERSGHFDPAYALIAGFVFYLFWNLATLLGIAAGQYIDGLDSMGLDFALRGHLHSP